MTPTTTVTLGDFERFNSALAAYGAVHKDHAARLLAAGDQAHALADAGRGHAGAALGASVGASAALAHVNAGAAFEAAAVAFLGERRTAIETPDAFVRRVMAELNAGDDMGPAIFAMQARNGITFIQQPVKAGRNRT